MAKQDSAVIRRGGKREVSKVGEGKIHRLAFLSGSLKLFISKLNKTKELDDEEKDFLESYERDEWEPVKDFEKELLETKKAAERYIFKFGHRGK